MPTTPEKDRSRAETSTGAGAASVESDVDALFALPLSEFTGSRNTLAARLKTRGQLDEAKRVKALSKPSNTAWAVNQLYWHHRAEFDQLLAAGERLRQAQATQLAGQGGDLRETQEERRKTLSHLGRLASALLSDAGHKAAPDTLRRITTTLEGLSVGGSQPDAPRPGRLTDDVDPPGFETLAALFGDSVTTRQTSPLTTPPSTGSSAGEEFKGGQQGSDHTRQTRIAGAKETLREARGALDAAERTASEAATALREATAAAATALQRMREAEAVWRKSQAGAEAAEEQVRHKTAESEAAVRQLEEQQKKVDDAVRQLEQATSERVVGP